VQEARRDVLFVDLRYFVTRDVVRLSEPKPVSLLLHAESPFTVKEGLATLQQPKAGCAIALVTPGAPWKVEVTDQFPTPVEEKYRPNNPNQHHLTATSPQSATEQVIYSVIWPWPGRESGQPLSAHLTPAGALVVKRPDGRTDTLVVEGGKVSLK
jgi:hypothetical protein